MFIRDRGSVTRYYNQFGKLWQYLLKINRRLPQDSAIPLLGRYIPNRNVDTCCPKGRCKNVHRNSSVTAPY